VDGFGFGGRARAGWRRPARHPFSQAVEEARRAARSRVRWRRPTVEGFAAAEIGGGRASGRRSSRRGRTAKLWNRGARGRNGMRGSRIGPNGNSVVDGPTYSLTLVQTEAKKSRHFAHGPALAKSGRRPAIPKLIAEQDFMF